MEGGLLSDPKLAKFYDKVVWMYLYQDFSGSDTDRAAQRVAIRFGITAWPQHFLVDPFSLESLADTGRSLDSFTAAVRTARVKKRRGSITPTELANRDAAAAELEQKVSTKVARERLKHRDVVVRYRAIEQLQEEHPDIIAKAAKELLAAPHDQTRFTVCKLLAKSGAGKDADAIADVLEELLKEPVGSNNPNMMRCYAAQALTKCGDRKSVDIVARFATTGLFFNMLTATSLDCLAAIAQRDKAACNSVAKHLLEAFPQPADDERSARPCIRLARQVHKTLAATTGKSIAFPETYDDKTRKQLIRNWTKKVRSR